MKNFTITSLLLIFSCYAYSQNSASTVKDTSLSMPEKTMEVFWQTFQDNYAFFKLRKIDWESTYKQYRPKIDATTTEDSLFNVLSQMVAPFHDDHINIIIPPHKRQYTSRKISPFLKDFPKRSSRDSLWDVVDRTLYKEGFGNVKSIGPEYRGKKLFYYTKSSTYGYIRMGRCFVSEATTDSVAVDSALAGRILDTLLQQMNDSKAIILDARMNIGGNDEFSYVIAGRFVSKKVLGHYKQTRITGTNNFTPLVKWYIIPQTSTPYLKKVIVLTNDQTASAGDVFAMIMKALPQTTMIGENTQGIYSDMYGFTLPNGWLASLSNQRYLSSKMICYEGKGTPVNIYVQNTKQDLLTMHDPVVITAINYLKKQ